MTAPPPQCPSSGILIPPGRVFRVVDDPGAFCPQCDELVGVVCEGPGGAEVFRLGAHRGRER